MAQTFATRQKLFLSYWRGKEQVGRESVVARNLFVRADREVDQKRVSVGCISRYLLIVTAAVFAVLHAPASEAQLLILGPSTSMANLTNGEDLIVGDKQ